MSARGLSWRLALGLALALATGCATAGDGSGGGAIDAASGGDGGANGDGGPAIDGGPGRLDGGVDGGAAQRCRSHGDCSGSTGFCCYRQDGMLNGMCTEGVIDVNTDACLPI